MSFRHLCAAPFAAFLLVAAPVAVASAAELQPLTITTTSGGEHELAVELADEPQERSKGLMYRRSLDPDEGMLFDFGEPRPITMWMKNTYIPLDMLFIDEAGTITGIAKRTTPMSERTIPSNGPARYVLEINGGRADALGIRPGDTVSGAGLAPD